MKRLFVILLCLLVSLSLYSQNYDSLKDSWDKILITDSYSGWSHFSSHFEIKKLKDELILTNDNDSAISKVDKTTLDKFFKSLTSEKGFSKDPLRVFGKDSIWLTNNAKKLWLSYLGDKNEPAEVDSFAIKIIKDYSKVKRLVWSIQGSHWTDDYPFTSVVIVKGKDSLSIHSSGQYPFMMPWRINRRAIYNSGISTALSEILPADIKSNRLRLAGDRFDYYLIDRIYDALIKEFRDYANAKLRYPNQFATLEQHFKIEDAELTDMGSIEWGGFISAPCLELILKGKELPGNIYFSVVYGRRVKLHSVKPIIKKKNKLVSRVTGNKVYQYTIANSNALGEIHFVNTKSLSGQAKRNFMSDVKENGMKKSIFRGRFRHAIFYELTEERGEARSFSRWIFLRDGTNILWEIQGSYLMDLGPDIVKEKGYVCRIVTSKE